MFDWLNGCWRYLASDAGEGSDGFAGEEGGSKDEEKGAKGKPADDGKIFKFGDEVLTHEEVQERLKAADEAKSDAEAALAQAKEKLKGANEKFEDSNQAIRLRTLLRAANKGGPDALKAYEALHKEFADETGITKENVEQMRARFKELEGQADDRVTDDGPVGYDDLDPEIQKDLKEMRDTKQRTKVDKIVSKMNSLLDKDKVVGDIMSDEALKRKTKHARDRALGVLSKRGFGKGPDWVPGADDYREAVQEARSFLMDVGLLEDPEEDEDGQAVSRADRAVPTLGRSPAVHRSRTRAKEPLERPDARQAAEHDNYLVQRFGQLLEESGGE